MSHYSKLQQHKHTLLFPYIYHLSICFPLAGLLHHMRVSYFSSLDSQLYKATIIFYSCLRMLIFLVSV
uniref:Uncharacterized protein n=1 Tax=Octopus bimaculoides TaxID=37653 RepID=A0A0L8GY87_OCTBM